MGSGETSLQPSTKDDGNIAEVQGRWHIEAKSTVRSGERWEIGPKKREKLARRRRANVEGRPPDSGEADAEMNAKQVSEQSSNKDKDETKLAAKKLSVPDVDAVGKEIEASAKKKVEESASERAAELKRSNVPKGRMRNRNTPKKSEEVTQKKPKEGKDTEEVSDSEVGE